MLRSLVGSEMCIRDRSLSPHGVKLANETNYVVASGMLVRNEERKKYLETKYDKKQGDPGPISIVLVGADLENALDAIESLEKRGASRAENSEFNEDEDSRSRVTSNDNQTNQKEKLNNFRLISEFTTRDETFILRLLAGEMVQSLEMIHEFEKVNEDAEDEDFSFLDEI
eukprot:TRINITY_DN22944_c0_g1_i1.p1 TRINITY_DN22944_c0_g1~~TRINITY_DN22944_c0_g1_i1.p1  ORF type:complete len:170 (+),score=54.07 TRINITY_DN22944_c0_g1_i1:2-511(+)